MFQNLLLFEHMTVLDNLLLGRHHLYKLGVLHDVFVRRRCGERKLNIDAPSKRLSSSPRGVSHVPHLSAAHGILKRVELGRIGDEPATLLLDEPAAG